MLNQPFATPSSVRYSQLWGSYANDCSAQSEFYPPLSSRQPHTGTTSLVEQVGPPSQPFRFRRWCRSFIVRFVVALGVLCGLGLLPARPAAAAYDADLLQVPLVNPRRDWSGHPRVLTNGHASKEAHRASLYAAIRRQSQTGASGLGARPHDFFH